MSLRTTAVLALVAGLLGAYVYFVDARSAKESAETAVPLEIEADDVRALELSLEKGAVTARLERDAEDPDLWRLSAPIRYRADSGTVSGILSTLAGLEAELVTDEPPEDLGPFGLVEGALTVRIFVGEEAPRVLRLGNETPVGSARYLQVEGDARLFTVAEWRASSFETDLFRLRDKRVTERSAEGVTGFQVVAGGALVVKARIGTAPPGGDEDAPWEVVEPVVDAGDGERIGRLIEDLSLLRARAFIDDPGEAGEYGLEPAELTIELARGEVIERFELGRKSGRTYVRTSQRPVVFEVPERVLTDVPRDLFAYRDKQVLSFDEDAAARVELEFPRDEETYALVKREGSWQVEEIDGELDSFRVDDLLYALHELEAIALEAQSADLGEIGLASPRVRVRVLDGAGAMLGQLELGNPTVERGTAARSTRRTDRLWRVDNAVGQDVPLSPEAFRNNFFEEAEPPDPEPAEAEPAEAPL
ncbi:MAG: DUF4340 domain-containing protein [Myxococcota bacterium]